MTHSDRSYLSAPAVQMALGAVISALVAIILDWAKRPQIRIDVFTLPHRVKQYGVLRQVVAEYDAVLVRVKNTKRFPRFWPRQTIASATAFITFHDPHNGDSLFAGQSMKGRWASQAQPEVVIVVDGVKQTWNDPALVSSHPAIDIAWGEAEELDVACKFTDEFGAYGFSNENYYDLQGRYRAARWRVSLPTCLVRVTVRGSGETGTRIFRLRNIRGTEKLILEPATWHEEAIVKDAVARAGLRVRRDEDVAAASE